MIDPKLAVFIGICITIITIGVVIAVLINSIRHYKTKITILDDLIKEVE